MGFWADVLGVCAENQHLKASLLRTITAEMAKINPAIVIQSIPVPKVPSKLMMIPDDQVRVVGISEYKAAALSLAQAFKDDDVCMYFVEMEAVKHWTQKEKWDLHLSIMEYLVYGHILKGLVTTVGPNYASVALW